VFIYLYCFFYYFYYSDMSGQLQVHVVLRAPQSRSKQQLARAPYASHKNKRGFSLYIGLTP
jgi:hypothetical protein